jgi:hypothetical protein
MAVVTDNDILRYIDTEKDLSRFNIKTLERLKDISASKRRILEIEREFVSLPLDQWEFEDVADVAAAISIYRSSRSLFYKTYGVKKPKSLTKKELAERLNIKIDFIQDAANEFTGRKVEEINLVQDEELFYELGKHMARRGRKRLQTVVKELEPLSLDELNKLEPIMISKDRARRQATLYSLGLYFREELSKIKIEASLTKESLMSWIDRLDSIMDNVPANLFKNYNVSLEMLPSEFDSGMGQNSYFRKTHRLRNILDFDNMVRDLSDAPSLFNNGDFDFAEPMVGRLTPDEKKVIGAGFSKEKRRKSKTKTFGVMLPIPRLGNEKMSLMHAHIRACGQNITPLFDECISNIRVSYEDEQVYFKALMMKPLWTVLDSSSNNVRYGMVLSRLIGYEFRHVEEFDKVKVIDLVNECRSDFMSLDLGSVAFVPKTRSEEDAFHKIKPWINEIASQLRDDYYTTTNDSC